MRVLAQALLTTVFVGFVASSSFAFPITIDPGAYTGRYFVFPPSAPLIELSGLSGPQTVDLPPGTSHIDTGASIGGSAFPVDIDGSGNITNIPNTAAATQTGPSSLRFNTVTISINVQNFTGGYALSSEQFVYPTIDYGNRNVVLVPGLAYSLDDGSEISGSALAFALDANGNVTVPAMWAGAASGAGSVLTLSNVDVQITTTFSGTYRVGSGSYVTGSGPIVLIPTLLTSVNAGDVHVVDIAPGLCQVTPATAALSGSTFTFQVLQPGPTCGPVYTGVIQPPIKADGSSVFKANRGAVPTKFTLTADGAPTCQLPAATISLLRTSGAAPGPINQTDYLQPSDSGATFRIDVASCQYVYNLGTSLLGAGQYLVQISINGVVIGRAAFGLN